MRHINEAGLNLIKSFEGCRLTAYKAVSTETYYTIGWGHYGPDVTKGMTITQAQADEMLKNDLVRYEEYTVKYCPFVDELNDNQFSALVSFCYNCGSGNLQKLCSHGGKETVPNYILLYNKSGGNVLAGLVRRRQAELDLYNTPIETEDDDMTDERFYELFKQSMDRYRAELGEKEPSDWAIPEFAKAIKRGITDGSRPLDFATRQDTAIMVKRAVSGND